MPRRRRSARKNRPQDRPLRRHSVGRHDRAERSGHDRKATGLRSVCRLHCHRPPLPCFAIAIRAQADYLGQASIAAQSRRWIEEALLRLDHLVAEPARPAKCLISFDTYPGDYLVTGDGRAVLVDLEKSRCSCAELDLAHATLVT